MNNTQDRYQPPLDVPQTNIRRCQPILIVTISQNPIFFVSTQPVRYPNISYGSRDSVSGGGRIHIRGIVVIIAAATIPFGRYVPYVYICVMLYHRYSLH